MPYNDAITMQAEVGINRKTFVWGLLLVWSPIVLFIVSNVPAVLTISRQRTSGLGAVAGGLSEALATYGLFVALASQVLAIVLLVRAFSQGQSLRRALVSIISICCAGVVLLICGRAIWFLVGRTVH